MLLLNEYFHNTVLKYMKIAQFSCIFVASVSKFSLGRLENKPIQTYETIDVQSR